MALIRRLRVQVDILRSPELPIGGCAKAISDIADALAAQADAQPEPVALTVAEAANRIRRGDHSAVNYNKVFGELTTAFTAAPPSGPTSFTIMEVGTAPQPAQPQYPAMPPLPRYEEVPTVTGTKIIVGQPAQPDVARLWALANRLAIVPPDNKHCHDFARGTTAGKNSAGRELAATLTELGMKP